MDSDISPKPEEPYVQTNLPLVKENISPKKPIIFKIVLVSFIIFICLMVLGIFSTYPWYMEKQSATVYRFFWGVYDVNGGWLSPMKIERIDGADPWSFTILTQKYYKDRFHIYSHNKIISDDPNNFKFIENKADPDGFYNFFAKDSKNVYYIGAVIQGADSKTFKELDYDLYVDKNRYYFNSLPIQYLNSSTRNWESMSAQDFAFLPYPGKLQSYTMGKAPIYAMFQDTKTKDLYVISNQLDSFALPPKAIKLPIRNPLGLKNSETWSNSGNFSGIRNYDYPIFLHDDGSVNYILTLNGVDLDPLTATEDFKRFCTGYRKENGVIYYFENQITSADLSTFHCKDIDPGLSTQRDSAYAFDSKNVFFRGKVIEKADVNTFVVVVDPSRKSAKNAFDKNNIYFEGKMITDSDRSNLDWLLKQPTTKQIPVAELI